MTCIQLRDSYEYITTFDVAVIATRECFAFCKDPVQLGTMCCQVTFNLPTAIEYPLMCVWLACKHDHIIVSTMCHTYTTPLHRGLW